MKLSHRLLQGSALALLVGLGSTFGIGASKLTRNYELAEFLGLDADVVSNGNDFISQIQAEEKPEELWIDMPIDHQNTSIGEYQHRYWVNESYYEPGGPVFVFDCGEGDGEPYAISYLLRDNSILKDLLKKFHGMGIVFEHRYYGKSNPYPVNLDTPSEHFQYLNNEQALADLPYLAKSFERKNFPKEDLTPKSTPWVMVGGSYPGMRAAFTRSKYPDTIFASWASSPPVQAQIDMSVYYEQVYRGLVKYGHENCTKDIHAAYRYIDRQLGRGDSAAAIKKLFLGDGAEENSNIDFTGALIVTYASWQSAGADSDVGDFCNWMETDPKTGKAAPAGGLAPEKGDKAMAERFAAWPKLAKLVNQNFDTNCRGLDSSKPASCRVDQRSTDQSTISWTWQYCTEWGYYQSNNWEPNTILSKYQTLEYTQQLCYRQFPDGLKSGYLPRQPDTESVNKATGGWHMRPSNLYTSGGEFDPWRTLSVLSTESFAPQGVEFSKEIPECNVATPQSKVFGYVMPSAQHCYDFRLDFKPGDVSRKLFSDALEKWLPCFKKTKHSSQ